MNTVRINPYAVLLYVFLAAIFYVAGMSFGGVLYFLFFALTLFPLFSLVHVVYSSLTFRFYQEFGNDHPVKGDTVVYKLCIENESRLPNPCVRAVFKRLGAAGAGLEPLALYLKRKESFVTEYRISCPYRGVYTVGLDSLTVGDMLGWVSFNPEVWFKTFYVYPRVIRLSSLFLDRHSHTLSGGTSGGTLADNLLFKGLGPYRAGMPVSGIYWKKFISNGEPVLREYESTSWPGLEIYLDMSRDEDATPAVLEREDCSIEIAISIAKYFLDRSIPMSLHALGEERYDFYGTDRSSFGELHKATIGLFFGKGRSIARAFAADRSERGSAMRTVCFVTHVPDPGIFELVRDFRARNAEMHVVLNQSGMDGEKALACGRYVRAFSDAGGSIRAVRGPDSIREDLEARE